VSPFLGTRGAGSNRAFGYAGAAAPAQVTGLTATDFGTSRAYNNGRIDLSWSTPANNGATISGYLIQRSTDGSSYSTLVANTGSATTTYSDTGLSSNQIYYYKVSAINAAGTGLASTAANATATTVPQAPTIGTATVTNSTTVSLAFTPGATGGKTITSYSVTSSPSIALSVSGTSSPLAVTGSFVANTAYTFTIAAVNANGTSSSSSASNSVTPLAVTPNVEYLVVAGGGGGGGTQFTSYYGGGGGAGGFRTATGLAVTAGSAITVTVGAGGNRAPTSGETQGSQGSNSVFGSITSTGGGGGGAGNTVGGFGGSGGGAGLGNTSSSSGGSGTGGQGNSGGNSVVGGGGGGGGGAGQSGISSTGNDVGGNGGNGTASSISGSSVTYAGGGGGGSGKFSAQSNGGTGGGGKGARDGGATAGTANTGGGGGAGTGQSSPHLGGNGGSGIVIIRYSDTYPLAASTTGSPTITTSGGYRIYNWTGSGSITF